MNDVSKIFREGYADFMNGMNRSDCPYDSHTQPYLSQEWILGWKAAKHDSGDRQKRRS